MVFRRPFQQVSRNKQEISGVLNPLLVEDCSITPTRRRLLGVGYAPDDITPDNPRVINLDDVDDAQPGTKLTDIQSDNFAVVVMPALIGTVVENALEALFQLVDNSLVQDVERR